MSLFKSLLESIPSSTKKYVNRQVGFATTVAEKLRYTGMTQRELAEKLGKKESYISRILSGEANPTLKTIAEVEVALGEDVISFNIHKKVSHQNRVFMRAEPSKVDFTDSTKLKLTSTSGVKLLPAIGKFKVDITSDNDVKAA
jgi:transcriptional regulator with XRE-family HTH domain